DSNNQQNGQNESSKHQCSLRLRGQSILIRIHIVDNIRIDRCLLGKWQKHKSISVARSRSNVHVVLAILKDATTERSHAQNKVRHDNAETGLSNIHIHTNDVAIVVPSVLVSKRVSHHEIGKSDQGMRLE